MTMDVVVDDTIVDVNVLPKRWSTHVHDRAVDDHDHVHVGDRWWGGGIRASCSDRDRTSLVNTDGLFTSLTSASAAAGSTPRDTSTSQISAADFPWLISETARSRSCAARFASRVRSAIALP